MLYKESTKAISKIGGKLTAAPYHVVEPQEGASGEGPYLKDRLLSTLGWLCSYNRHPMNSGIEGPSTSGCLAFQVGLMLGALPSGLSDGRITPAPLETHEGSKSVNNTYFGAYSI